MIKVEINGRSNLSEKEIIKVLRASLRKAGTKTANLSVAFVKKNEIKRLNKIYRKKNKATDILSFGFSRPLIIEESGGGKFGELIISPEEAKLNAKAKKTSLKNELRLLLVHGALHLCGYDHEKKADKKKMFALQEEILKSLVMPRT